MKDSDYKCSFYKYIYDQESFTFRKSKDALFIIGNINISNIWKLFADKLYIENRVYAFLPLIIKKIQTLN